MNSLMSDKLLDRRALLVGGGLATVSLIAQPVFATPEDLQRAVAEAFGDRPISEGRVAMTLPPISENGNSVAVKIDVDSSMTSDDYVKKIALFSEENPLPNIANYHLGPRSGKASVSARIRLNTTQIVLAIAEMSDGSLWSGGASTVVTLPACVIF